MNPSFLPSQRFLIQSFPSHSLVGNKVQSVQSVLLFSPLFVEGGGVRGETREGILSFSRIFVQE